MQATLIRGLITWICDLDHSENVIGVQNQQMILVSCADGYRSSIQGRSYGRILAG